uniref:hypothetical protein n=1 Tax=Microscilla sp. PRE1 TaxID=155537 RepID=UPI00146A62AD|nr:hypothetical protein [Microscilla sp. PRE1]
MNRNNIDEELMHEIDAFVADLNDNFDHSAPFPKIPYTQEQIKQYNAWDSQKTLDRVFGPNAEYNKSSIS